MIPLMEKTKILEAKYTKLLKDVSSSILDAIDTVFNGFDNNSELYEHFIHKYRIYEICTEDEDEFKDLVLDVYYEHEEYFKKILTAYKKDIDIDDITTKETTRTDTSSGSKSGTANVEDTNVHREYELPNKSISAQQEDGYLTGKDTTNDSNEATSSETHSNTYGSDISTKDNKDFIRLKKEYLAHVRDIYEEFTDRFYDCFLHIY